MLIDAHVHGLDLKIISQLKRNSCDLPLCVGIYAQVMRLFFRYRHTYCSACADMHAGLVRAGPLIAHYFVPWAFDGLLAFAMHLNCREGASYD